jgi:hypothetical protein
MDLKAPHCSAFGILIDAKFLSLNKIQSVRREGHNHKKMVAPAFRFQSS